MGMDDGHEEGTMGHPSTVEGEDEVGSPAPRSASQMTAKTGEASKLAPDQQASLINTVASETGESRNS